MPEVAFIDYQVGVSPIGGATHWVKFTRPVTAADLDRCNERGVALGIASAFQPVAGHADEAWLCEP